MSFTAFLVDDDPGVLKALSRIVRTAGYETVSYSSPRDFLREHDPSTPGCAILDLTMPELDGLELQQQLTQAGTERPIIFLTGHADVPASVRAMKAGAVDFLIKPVDRDKLLSAIAQAKDRDSRAREARNERQLIEAKLATLTQREREVLEHVVKGRLNKQIAAELGTVEKTIKVHRGRMMAKLGVRSVAELVRLTGRIHAEP
ncbi:MAG: response regulator [Xanthobacteraceae bacterium]|nr:response regulator [Xanthobacteraceae bacterium]